MRSDPQSAPSDPLANPFGVTEALIGLVFGFLLSIVFVGAYEAISHPHGGSNTYGDDIASLLGLWIGLVGAAVVALLAKQFAPAATVARFRRSYGLYFRPVDLPVGIVAGVGAQFILVPLLELPLRPFVPNLANRLGEPARTLTNHVTGGGLVLLGLCICVGSPLVEELFFRGLLLRGLLGRFGSLGSGVRRTCSIVICGTLFGLVHFEALQLTALIGAGCLFGILTVRFGRLGPGIVAHAAFNTTTFIALVWTH